MCVMVWRGRGREGGRRKNTPLGEQGHGGVGKDQHTIPPSSQWQGGNICRTSGACRWVGSVLGVCREDGCCMHGSEKLVKNHHTNRCDFFKNELEQTKPISSSLELGVESVCLCPPHSQLHSLATYQLGSATTTKKCAIATRGYRHTKFSNADKRTSDIPKQQPIITCVKSEITFIYRASRKSSNSNAGIHDHTEDE